MVAHDAGDIVGKINAAVDCRHMHQERAEVLINGVNNLQLKVLNKGDLMPKEEVDLVAESTNLLMHGGGSDNEP